MTLPFGLILAGGESRRMGRDKAFVECDGRPLHTRMVDRLMPQCCGIAFSRHGPGDAGLGRAVVADDDEVRAGPLAGLLAGLDWIARTHPGLTHAVSVPVDLPFLPSDLVSRLVAARDAAGAEIACAASGGRRHPLAALWRIDLRHDLRRALASEDLRKVGAFVDRYVCAVAEWATGPGDPFLNVNTPDDVAVAEARLRRERDARPS